MIIYKYYENKVIINFYDSIVYVLIVCGDLVSCSVSNFYMFCNLIIKK